MEEDKKEMEKDGVNISTAFKDSPLNEEIRDILNKKTWVICDRIYEGKHKTQKPLNYLLWNLKQWYDQVPANDWKDKSDACKEIEDEKKREKCMKKAKEPYAMHKALYPSFLVACGDSIPSWEVVKHYLTIAYDFNYYLGTWEKVEEEKAGGEMIGNDEGEYDYSNWSESDKARYLWVHRSFNCLKIPEEVRELLTPDKRHRDKDTGKPLTACGFTVNVSVCYDKLKKAIENTTSKEEADEIVREIGSEIVLIQDGKATEQEQNTIKANAWLLRCSISTVKKDKALQGGIIETFHYITKEEFDEKMNFLQEKLPAYRRSYAAGIKVKIDGTAIKGQKRIGRGPDGEIDPEKVKKAQRQRMQELRKKRKAKRKFFFLSFFL